MQVSQAHDLLACALGEFPFGFTLGNAKRIPEDHTDGKPAALWPICAAWVSDVRSDESHRDAGNIARGGQCCGARLEATKFAVF